MEPIVVPLGNAFEDEPAPAAELLDAPSDFGAVFQAHQTRLLRVAYLLTGDRERAEDSVAEAFAKVWPHWQRGRVDDERSYLTRAVVNEVTSVGRRLTVATRLRHRTATPAVALPGDDASAERLRVVSALAALPARQRAVIVLRFYDDLSEAAAAEVLGMRVGTVKSQTSRGLARLRTILQEEER